MLNSNATQTRFVIAVLCPAATFSHLLTEAKSKGVVILEMTPYKDSLSGYERFLKSGTSILFVCGAGDSHLLEHPSALEAAIASCNCVTEN